MIGKNNPRERVPIELKELADKIKINLNKPTRVEAYRTIAEVGKYNFAGMFSALNIGKNKKGQILDIIAFGFLALFFALVIAIAMFGVDSFNSIIQDHEQSAELRSSTAASSTSLKGWFDFGFGFFFFMLLLIFIIANFFIQLNIVWTIIYICSVLFMGAIFTAINNGLHIIKVTFPTVFSGMPISSFIIDSFFPIMALFYLFFFVTIFSKPRGEGA